MSNIEENKRFVIFDVSESHLVDYSEVFEDSQNTLQISVDGSKTFVQYFLPQPSSVSSLTTKSIEYTYEQIIEILYSEDWVVPTPPIL